MGIQSNICTSQEKENTQQCSRGNFQENNMNYNSISLVETNNNPTVLNETPTTCCAHMSQQQQQQHQQHHHQQQQAQHHGPPNRYYFIMSILSLCSCVLVFVFLSRNLLPYVGFMCMHLVDGLTHDSVGSYAGICISSFLMGNCLTSFGWGKLADIYGRRFVLIASLILSAIFSFLFGLSTSFTMAIVVRFVMGAVMGVMPVVYTAVTELAHGDRALESRGMGIVMSMVGYALLISSGLGGALSDPMKQYPDTEFFGGMFDPILTRHPFLAPNILGSVFCILSLVFVMFFFEETLAEEECRDAKYFLSDAIHRIKFLATPAAAIPPSASPESRPLQDLTLSMRSCETFDGGREKGYGGPYHNFKKTHGGKQLWFHEQVSLVSTVPSVDSCSDIDIEGDTRSTLTNCDSDNGNVFFSKEATITSILSKESTRRFLISLWLNSFVVDCINGILPLFAMATQGGLHMKANTIGMTETLAGVFFCLSQYVIFTTLMQRYGLLTTMQLGSLFAVVAMFFPFSMLLNGGSDSSGSEFSTIVLLSLLMGIITVGHSVCHAASAMGANRTVEATHRATLNGFSNFGVSVARSVGFMFAGVLVSFCLSGQVLPAEYGPILIYAIMTIVALSCYAFTRFDIEKEHH